MVLVGGGSAFGQAVLLVAAPILSRLYEPAAFGVLAVYTAGMVLGVTVVSLRFDAAIPIAADDDEAIHLLVLSIILAVVLSLVLGIVVFIWGADVASTLGAAQLAPFLFLLVMAVLAGSVTTALSSWAVYHRLFPSLARVRAVQSSVQVVAQVAFGLVHAGPVGLIAGDVVGRFAGTQTILRSVLAALRTTKLSAITVRRYAREHWGFARLMTAASVLNTLTQQVPFLVIPAAFGLDASGQFFLAYRMLVLPAALVSAAVNQVFFGEASARRGDPARLERFARDATVSLFVFSIPTYLIVAVGGSALMQSVFGAQWATAGLYAAILAPSLVVHAVAGPISSLLLVGRRQRESLAFTAAELTAQAGALVLGVAVHSLTVGIVALSAVSLLLAVASLWRFLRVASVRLVELLRPTSTIFGAALPSVAFVGLVAVVAPGWTVGAAAAGWVVAVLAAARLTRELRAFLGGAND